VGRHRVARPIGESAFRARNRRRRARTENARLGPMRRLRGDASTQTRPKAPATLPAVHRRIARAARPDHRRGALARNEASTVWISARGVKNCPAIQRRDFATKRFGSSSAVSPPRSLRTCSVALPCSFFHACTMFLGQVEARRRAPPLIRRQTQQGFAPETRGGVPVAVRLVVTAENLAAKRRSALLGPRRRRLGRSAPFSRDHQPPASRRAEPLLGSRGDDPPLHAQGIR
jgi:hypothetical protein